MSLFPPLETADLMEILALYPLGIVLSSLDGVALWANSVACQALQQPLEAIQGQRMRDVISLSAEQQALLVARLQVLQAGGDLMPSRYRVTLPGGAECLLEAHTWRLSRSPSAPVLLCSLVRDVTEEVAAAARLRERERRFQQLTAATTEGIVFHRDMIITDCNPAMAAMLGTTVEDVVGARVEEFLPPEALVQVRPVVAAQREGNYAFNVRRRDGTTFPAELAGRPIQVEDGWLRVVSVRDVSAQKATEAALEDAQARFAALSRAAPVGLGRFGLDLRLEECNDAWAAQIGAEAQRLLGEGWRDYLYPAHAETVIMVMRETIETGQPRGGVFRVITPDGRERWIEGQFSSHSGRPGSCISAVTDVTDRILAERQRTRALREKEVLLKEIHHRVKNNLLLVSSLLLLQQVQSRDPLLAHVFGNLHARIDAMALVHKLVYQSESLSQVSADVYSRALIDGLQSSMRPPETQVTVEALVAPVRMEVGQAIPFGLLLNELLTNALQHAFPGRPRGRIAVTFAALPARSGWWRLRVADDGVGLSGVPHRTGALGMQLIDMLSEQLDGEVQQETAPGAGLAITICFPLSTRSAS